MKKFLSLLTFVPLVVLGNGPAIPPPAPAFDPNLPPPGDKVPIDNHILIISLVLIACCLVYFYMNKQRVSNK